MAKLVARLQATAALWIDSRHLSKIQNGNINMLVTSSAKKSPTHSSPPKNIKRKNYTVENFKTAFRDREYVIMG